MKSLKVIGYVLFFFLFSLNSFAQDKLTDKEAIEKMTFKFKGADWIFQPQEPTDSLEARYGFLNSQKWVIGMDLHGYKIVDVKEKNPDDFFRSKKAKKLKGVKYKLQYNMVSCGIYYQYMYMIKESKQKLVFEGDRSGQKVVFVKK